jgi:phage host-nuclease inhibitor protein Gam
MNDPALPADAIRASAGDVTIPEQYAAGAIDRSEAGRWQITTQGAAAWAIARYREAQALLAGIDAQANEWRNDVEVWRQQSVAPLERTLDLMGENLRRYALTLREESEGKVKTVALPGGRIETHGTTRPKVCVEDEAAVLEWAKKNQPAAVKTEESLLVSKLVFVVQREEGAVWGKLIEPTSGEVIPGVHAEWSPTTAQVKV